MQGGRITSNGICFAWLDQGGGNPNPEGWSEVFGLLPYGSACIANYLIERNTPACMINLSTVMNAIGGFQGKEKNEYIANLMQYPLLILDDFGMERQTEYALEQVFNVIDARYQSNKPLIVTTNLSLPELRNPQTREQTRIYDRILEMCTPVNFGNSGRRSDKAQAKMQRAAEILKARS